MKHFYSKWNPVFLILLTFLLGSDFTVSAIQRTIVLNNREDNPIAHYTFKILPLEIMVTTDAKGEFSYDFPEVGAYDIVPQYWDEYHTAGNFFVDENIAEKIIVRLECNSVATFALNGLEPSMYNEVSEIQCNGRRVMPDWDANGKFRYLVEFPDLSYQINSSLLPNGYLYGRTSEFTQEIVLTFDVAGKQKVTFSVGDVDGAPLQNANVSFSQYSPGGDYYPSVSIGVTGSDGKVSGYIAPGEYTVIVSKSQDGFSYGSLKQRVSVTGESDAFDVSYQGNCAVINVTAKGYDRQPLGGVSVSFRKNGNTLSSAPTYHDGRLLCVITEFGEIEYNANCYGYAKKIEDKITIARNEQKNLTIDYSDCKRVYVDLADIPQEFQSINGMIGVYSAETGSEVGTSNINLIVENPEASYLPTLYVAPGNYRFLLWSMSTYTHAGEVAVYPVENNIQVSGAQTVTFSLQGMRKIDFEVTDSQFDLWGIEFYKNNEWIFTVNRPVVYMKDGQYSWKPNLMSQGDENFLFPEAQAFSVEGSGKIETWSMSAYHKATFSFGGTQNGVNSGYIDIMIFKEEKELISTNYNFDNGKTKVLYLPDGNYTYVANPDELYKADSAEDIWYVAPQLKGDLTINGSDVEKTLSYLNYTPVILNVTKSGEAVPFYYFEVKNTDGKKVLFSDVSGDVIAYLLPGTYQFTATAPLCSTAKENKVIQASATKVDLVLTESNNYGVVLYFYDKNWGDLSGVKVEIEGYETQYTDEFGVCSYFDIPAGITLKVKASKDGYKTIESDVLVTISDEDLADEASGVYQEFKMLSETSGIDNTEAEDPVVVYPNPVVKSFKVRLPENSGSNQWGVSVYDLNGSLMLKKDIVSGEPTDVSGLSSGIYMIRLTDGIQTLCGKLIKR